MKSTRSVLNFANNVQSELMHREEMKYGEKTWKITSENFSVSVEADTTGKNFDNLYLLTAVSHAQYHPDGLKCRTSCLFFIF